MQCRNVLILFVLLRYFDAMILLLPYLYCGILIAKMLLSPKNWPPLLKGATGQTLETCWQVSPLCFDIDCVVVIF